MKTYMVERGTAMAGKQERKRLQEAVERSYQALCVFGQDVQWLESFVTADKTFGVYRAKDDEIIQQYLEFTGFPASKITEIAQNMNAMAAEAG